MTQVMIVVPARYASTRLERKMLLSKTGKPLIQHTYEAASQATQASKVLVATDHPEIEQAVRHFGGEAIMTDPNAQSGTDRIAEVARAFSDYELVVNVQGDEPEIEPEAIDLAIRILREDSTAMMSTLATPIRTPETLSDPAAVKVVMDQNQQALYFSRSPIPFPRAQEKVDFSGQTPSHYLHLGLYVYRRDFLLKIPNLPPSRMEKLESLEQLRILDHGHRIKVGIVSASQGGIDTLQDYAAFVRRQQNC